MRPAFFCHRCFVQLDKSVQNKLHKCMKKKFISGNHGLNNLKCFLEHLTLVTLTFNRVPLLPRMCELSRSRTSRVIDQKRFGTFDRSELDPVMYSMRKILYPLCSVLVGFRNDLVSESFQC